MSGRWSCTTALNVSSDADLAYIFGSGNGPLLVILSDITSLAEQCQIAEREMTLSGFEPVTFGFDQIP